MVMPEPANRGVREAEAEVRLEFDRYERSLVAGDAEAMNAQFWASSHVVRFGVADMQFGSDEVTSWRREQPPLPPGRRLHATRVTGLSADVVVVTTCFRYPGIDRTGRQTQVWARLADGWRVVSAHVSEIADEP